MYVCGVCVCVGGGLLHTHSHTRICTQQVSHTNVQDCVLHTHSLSLSLSLFEGCEGCESCEGCAHPRALLPAPTRPLTPSRSLCAPTHAQSQYRSLCAPGAFGCTAPLSLIVCVLGFRVYCSALTPTQSPPTHSPCAPYSQGEDGCSGSGSSGPGFRSSLLKGYELSAPWAYERFPSPPRKDPRDLTLHPDKYIHTHRIQGKGEAVYCK